MHFTGSAIFGLFVFYLPARLISEPQCTFLKGDHIMLEPIVLPYYIVVIGTNTNTRQIIRVESDLVVGLGGNDNISSGNFGRLNIADGVPDAITCGAG